jgi:hypothetical protein
VSEWVEGAYSWRRTYHPLVSGVVMWSMTRGRQWEWSLGAWRGKHDYPTVETAQAACDAAAKRLTRELAADLGMDRP